jgi:hypothetical protein
MDTNLHQRVILRLHNAWQLSLLGICLIVAVSSVAAFAQIPPTLTPDEATQVRRLIQTWLECSVCDYDDSSPELRSVIERGGAAIEPLRTALLEGPSAGDLELLRAHLRTTYKKLKDSAITPGELPISRTQESFVEMYVDNYVASYKIRAAQALGAIGAAQARDSSVAKQAKEALEKAGTQPNPKDVDRAISAAVGRIH